ncbi:hypothetical protein PoB_003081500 [Plakobranchus ocellatus]|uniref:Uncharacterized protein n=1 Tax=Plakobranchus ocellatus TaxID=259542 RepID=A0AAV4AA96_9GAST|nr:hypothetical protein PoB_003081500 [Plakobranchus ocellatus]
MGISGFLALSQVREASGGARTCNRRVPVSPTPDRESERERRRDSKFSDSSLGQATVVGSNTCRSRAGSLQ